MVGRLINLFRTHCPARAIQKWAFTLLEELPNRCKK
jgi:hypothetical protein